MNLTKISAVFLLSFFFVFGAFAASEKAVGETQQQEIEDPDLKLSIEDLKKKYPIDWLEKKYGEASEKYCDDGDDEPWLREVKSWPCGPACNEKEVCSKDCYNSQKPLPKNLICSFFKQSYDKNVNEWVADPVARFKDFSESEIKSSFLHTPSFTGFYKDCNTFEGDCLRLEQIVAITFIYFLNKSDSSLTKEEKQLKHFIFSTKISEFKPDSWNNNRCESFKKRFISASVSSTQNDNFCSNSH